LPVGLVSGANRGIGRETARQLAGRGYDVIVAARDEAKASARVVNVSSGNHDNAVLRVRVGDGIDEERVVWLATLPDDGPTGGFFRDGEPVAF
jgi:NAD(P)-dependent dehydrogenase (short-subunit alcohol dehydrogenase family)